MKYQNNILGQKATDNAGIILVTGLNLRENERLRLVLLNLTFIIVLLL